MLHIPHFGHKIACRNDPRIPAVTREEKMGFGRPRSDETEYIRNRQQAFVDGADDFVCDDDIVAATP